MFLNKQSTQANNDLKDYSLNDYLEQTKNFKSSFKEFDVKQVDGFNIIHDSGSKVSSSIVLIDRLETSHSIFDSLGMKLSNVTNIVDIANILHSKSIIDNEQKNLVLANIID